MISWERVFFFFRYWINAISTLTRIQMSFFNLIAIYFPLDIKSRVKIFFNGKNFIKYLSLWLALYDIPIILKKRQIYCIFNRWIFKIGWLNRLYSISFKWNETTRLKNFFATLAQNFIRDFSQLDKFFGDSPLGFLGI